MTARYAYAFDEVDFANATRTGTTKLLALRAEDGWELVSVVSLPGLGRTFNSTLLHYYWQRLVEEETHAD